MIDTMDSAQQQHAAPINNGDNSNVTGDKPFDHPTSAQILNEKESLDATKVTSVNSAQIINTTTPIASSSPKGESYDQVRKLGEKVEHAVLPEELRTILNERIARLALIRSGAGFMSSTYILEYESTSRYINWVVGLPWDKKSQDLLNLAKAREILDKNHYGLDMLKQRVLEYIASIMLNIKNNGPEFVSHSPILCFVGLAGTGKTTFAKSVAEALGRQFERIPFGGMADSRVLRGQSRYFPDAEPGLIIKRLVHANAKNPVILLDELDRVTETARSDIMGVLIELLDPEQNSAFTDHYIDYPFNLSNSLFIATANNTTAISTAVLDRLEIIQMPSYTDEEKMMIGKTYVFPKTRQLIGLKPDQLAIDDDVWPDIIRPLGYDSGIRSLDRTISGMCRKAAQMIVEGQAQNVRITNDNVKQFLPQY
ncbi:MAG TPA: AAA family ATPase [Methylomirabilota bacterium]|nr:AAA family ATPase [Methylomirabilota bacterium]